MKAKLVPEILDFDTPCQACFFEDAAGSHRGCIQFGFVLASLWQDKKGDEEAEVTHQRTNVARVVVAGFQLPRPKPGEGFKTSVLCDTLTC